MKYQELIMQGVDRILSDIVDEVLSTPPGWETWIISDRAGNITFSTQTPSTRPGPDCGDVIACFPWQCEPGEGREYLRESAEYWDEIKDSIRGQVRNHLGDW